MDGCTAYMHAYVCLFACIMVVAIEAHAIMDMCGNA